MIQTFSQGISYLRHHVPSSSRRFPGQLGLDRQLEILRLLGNPQNKIKAIHIAGTSGKGSTASYLSHLLVAHQFNVGLTLSPHLLDIRERFQINNKFISKQEFVFYLNQIIPVIEKVANSNFGSPTFFEIITALSFFIFYQKKVDFAVVETGLGGLLDGTNTISSPSKFSVFTKIGLDHTHILGPNLTSIAFQKAGIIHPKNTVISINQYPSVKKILNQTTQKNHTQITFIAPRKNFKNIHIKNLCLYYDYQFDHIHFSKIKLNTLALYQVENSALSLTVLKFLSQKYDFILNEKNIRHTLSHFKFYGRMDFYQLKSGHRIVLDGAHNPQKMKSFIQSLKNAFPNQKFTFIIAFKQRRDFKKILKYIIPLAQNIIVTSFLVTSQDMIHTSQPIKTLIQFFKSINFSQFKIISDPKKAINSAVKLSQFVVITGSLYLLGEIYPQLKLSGAKN